MNSCALTGRLGKDPELKYTSNNLAKLDVSIATVENRKQDENTPANWVNVEIWQGQAEYIANNANKGDLIIVRGRIKTDSWEKDGVKHNRTYVVAETVELGQKATTSNKNMANETVKPKEMKQEDYKPSSDLPF